MEDINYFLIEMLKESFNLIGQEHIWSLIWNFVNSFVKKLFLFPMESIDLSFGTIFNLAYAQANQMHT